MFVVWLYTRAWYCEQRHHTFVFFEMGMPITKVQKQSYYTSIHVLTSCSSLIHELFYATTGSYILNAIQYISCVAFSTGPITNKWIVDKLLKSLWDVCRTLWDKIEIDMDMGGVFQHCEENSSDLMHDACVTPSLWFEN